ncbi:hypothetical protein E8K88_02515 [Lampropedia aestuarii]|uniref:Uncharacterized protein n=1 Tax=Lampropedia aestuarii TaxID=2562762 RepID=A0A4S5BTF9_9BURK|nr:hypothetical protein [Lampropedia aestuarii]THJ36157.1 hypothetical protein E8K88_02515 [Lampropedia aestuarii]
MHAPRPYGRFAEDAELSTEDAAAVSFLAKRLSNFKQVSELDSLRWRRVLPSGREAILRDMGGVFKVVVLSQNEPPPPAATKFATDPTRAPMLFSGVPTVTRVNLAENGKVRISLTQTCRKRLVQYGQGMAPASVELERFNVPVAFQDLRPLGAVNPDMLFTQYDKLYPSWYSGAMQKLVQCVLGYGQQGIPSGVTGDAVYEGAYLAIPKEYQKEIAQELEGITPIACSGEPIADGQVRYDFHYSRTHAVTIAGDGKPWLVQVVGQWVDAMPLPVVPTTATAGFKAFVRSVGDDELLELLDTFGGMPTGELFPEDGSREAWRKAGAIVRVGGTGGFYQHSALFDTCGWAFADHGREGYNTCIERRINDPVEETGMLIAHGFKMKVNIGASSFDGKRPAWWVQLDQETEGTLMRYFRRLFDGLAQVAPQERAAIEFKMWRSGRNTVASRLPFWDSQDFDFEINYWRNMELAPLAVASGGATRVASGPYVPHIDFKVPSTALGGNIDLRTEMWHDPNKLSGYPQRWDTVLYGYYSGNTLKVVKQHREDGVSHFSDSPAFPSCMQVGTFERTQESGTARVAGGIYTTDYDYREELRSDTVTTTKIVGKDLGYSEPYFIFDYEGLQYGAPGFLYRARYYQRERTTTTVYGGQSLAVGACVPFYNRNALIFVHAKWNNGRSEIEYQLSLGWQVDPTRYPIHWVDQSGGWGASRIKVTVTGGPNKSVVACNFADDGDWAGLRKGDVITSYIRSINWPIPQIHPVWGGGPWGTIGSGWTGGGSWPKIKPTPQTLEVKPAGTPYQGDVEWEQRGAKTILTGVDVQWNYLMMSPPRGGQFATFQEDSTRNAMGQAMLEMTTAGAARKGFSRLQDARPLPLFIGVVNE